MFYAASEIVFWILLAAIIGGGIGYGLSETKSVRLGKRLSDSRADAPMERELAIAWDTIEDLNRRLQVAHETIRGGHGDAAQFVAAEDSVAEDEIIAEASPADLETAEDVLEADDDTTDDDPANDDAEDAAPAGPLVHTVDEVVPFDEIEDDDAGADDGVVGTRLSDRVASASIGNQIEIIKTVEF